MKEELADLDPNDVPLAVPGQEAKRQIFNGLTQNDATFVDATVVANNSGYLLAVKHTAARSAANLEGSTSELPLLDRPANSARAQRHFSSPAGGITGFTALFWSV